MHKYGRWIRETTVTAGVGPVSLGGAVVGFAEFQYQFNDGDRVLYSLWSGDDREIGVGTYRAGNILERTTLRATIVAGAYNDVSPTPIDLTGTSEVMVTDDKVLHNWAEDVRESTGNGGKALIVNNTTGIAELSDVSDAGTF